MDTRELFDLQRGHIRILFSIAILLSAFALGFSFADTTSATSGKDVLESEWDKQPQNRQQLAPPRSDITVITTQKSGMLYAIAPNGTLYYYNDSLNPYWDVDPSPEGRTSVVYVATNKLNKSECPTTTYHPSGLVCAKNIIERVNLTTGETTRLYSFTVARDKSTKWHDVDRISDDKFVVADIKYDRVFIVNTTTGIITWEWQVQTDYPLSTGGSFPKDFTHLNDVEHLPDGRIMASLRNHDQVVFLNRSGLIKQWTLGEDDNHDILYEQHNPDYIPESDGGPAVIVSDSENNRVIEYQRMNNSWNRTWVWQDDRLAWPRDADRLPSGHTLITDSNGGRVFEIDESGSIVWNTETVDSVYEAERLGTGAESTGGPSARSAELNSKVSSSDGPASSGTLTQKFKSAFIDILPDKLLNGIRFILPKWVGFFSAITMVFIVGISLLWGVLEYRWSRYRIGVSFPISIRKN